MEELFAIQPAGSPGLQVRTLSVALFTRPRPVMPGVVFFVSREVFSRWMLFHKGASTHTMLCLVNFLFIVPVNVNYRSEKIGSYAVSTFSLRQNLQLAVAESVVGYGRIRSWLRQNLQLATAESAVGYGKICSWRWQNR